MSLISGLGHIFHGIGNFFDGNDDDQKKKQQNLAPTRPTVVRPTQNQSPIVLNTQDQQNAIKSPNLNITALQKINGVPLGVSNPLAIPLQKVNPTQTQAPAAPAAPKGHASFLHDITHNIVTNLAGGIVKPIGGAAEYFGKNDIIDPTRETVDQLTGNQAALAQENADQNVDLGLSKRDAKTGKITGNSFSGGLKKLAGNTAVLASTVLAPGVDSLATDGVKAISGDAAEQLAKTKALTELGMDAPTAVKLAQESVDAGASNLVKIAPKVITGSVVGGTQGAAGTAQEGGSLKQIVKSGITNALVGGATAGFFTGIPVLAKAVRDGHITPQEADSATEVAEGIHTVNPNRPTDAAAQVGTPPEAPHQSGVVDDATPAPIPEANIAPIDPNTVPQPLPEMQPISPDEMHPTETDSLKAMNDAAKTRKLTPTELEARDSLQAKQDAIAAANAPAAEVAEKGAAAKPAAKAPAKGGKITAPDAPGIQEQNLKAIGNKVDSAGGQHDVIGNKDLTAAGKEFTDTLTDKELTARYHGVPDFHGAADVAEGIAARDRLSTILEKDPENVDAQKALQNVMEASEKEISGGGRTTNYAQEFYDGLKGPAKTSYLMRSLNKVRQSIGRADYTEDEAKTVSDTIQSHVDDEEKVKGAISTMQDRLGELKAEAEKAQAEGAQVPKSNTKEAITLNNAIKDRQLELSKNTSDLGKFYEHEAPQSLAVKAKAGDFGRSLMLSSVAGRANDLATTSINVGHQVLQNTGEALLGKALHKAPGQVIDTLPSARAMARGVKFGLKKSVARFKGNVAGNANTSELLKKAGDATGKGQLSNRSVGITAGLRKVVRSATEVATDVSEGIKEQRIQQLAAQEGKKAGLDGENLKAWTQAQTADPTRHMKEAGEQLQAEVNNMQDNRITEGLGRISDGFAKFPVIGEQLKNMTLPFTRWTGGQMHNALVDKNVLVNGTRMVKAMIKGDTQGAITEASKVAVNGVGSIGLGYTLAKSGLISNTNAQGYDDDGKYLHVGNRYIPVSFLGFFAPGIVMGASAHDAMAKTGTDGKHGSILDQVLNGTGDTLKAAYKSLGGDSLTGVSNPVIQALEEANKNGFKPVLSALGGETASDYVPAVLGDINAGLNNGIGVGPAKVAGITNPLHKIPGTDFLNPTHEASETKVTQGSEGKLTKSGKPSAAKDSVRTSLNEQLNKIPVVSQLLFDRKKGIAANDEIDRTTRGDRDTTGSVQARADAATKVKTQQSLDDRIASNNKAGIPDPDADSSSDSTQHYAKGDTFKNAVENRVENGKYDQALSGLNLQLSELKASKDATSAQTDPVQKQIGQIQVLKDGKYNPAIRDTYSHVSVDEWRAMGDPDSDTYDPEQYAKLYTYDEQLAAHDASDNTDDSSQPKYTAKAPKKTSSSKSATAAADLIKGNKLSATTPSFKAPDLSNLSPQKVDSTAVIPTIQKMQAGDLIKKRKISVS